MLRRLALAGAMTVLAIGLLAPAAMAGEEKVTICHKPGTPAERTLTVAAAAVDAHLAHGDTLGACGGSPPTDGCTVLNDPEYDGVYVQARLNGLVFGPAYGPPDPGVYFGPYGPKPFSIEVVASWLPAPVTADAELSSYGTYFAWVDIGGMWPPVGEPVSISWRASNGPVDWTVGCYEGG